VLNSCQSLHERMGLGDERIVNPKAVSKSLRCVICTDVFIDPVSANRLGHCQHVFCRSCIERALLRRHACPTCNAVMHASELQRNILAQSLLDEIEIRCSCSDCNWTGPQDQLAAHEAKCPVVARDSLRRVVAAQQVQLNMLQDQVTQLAKECSARMQHEKEMEMQVQMLEEENREKDDMIASQQQQLEIEQEEVLRAQRQTRDQEARGNLNWIQVKRVDWDGDLSVNPSRVKGFQVAVEARGHGTLLLKSITQAADGMCRMASDGGS